MSGFAQTYVTGYVQTQPDFKYLQSGMAVCSFNIPISTRWTDKQGTQQEKTTWYRVQTFGKQAETMNQYVTKGMVVAVVGTIEAHGYQNKNGDIVAQIDLKAQSVQFISKADQQQREEQEDVFADVVLEGDLPF